MPFWPLHSPCRQVFIATINECLPNMVHFVMTMPERVLRSKKDLCLKKPVNKLTELISIKS